MNENDQPTVTTLDLRTIELVLEMGDGYVLDFTNATFAYFMADLGIATDGLQGSKATRLRAILRSETPSKVALILRRLLEHRGEESDDDPALLARYEAIVQRLSGSTVDLPFDMPDSVDVLSLAYVAELDAKATRRLSDGDFEGAITCARTMLESVLVEVETRLSGQRGDHKRDLQGQLTVVRKLLHIDAERKDLDDAFKQMVKGLVLIVDGLAPLRNKASDAHARERKPAPHHARFAVNCAKSVTSFLIESFRVDHAAGRLDSG